jgi:hypothetical protein
MRRQSCRRSGGAWSLALVLATMAALLAPSATGFAADAPLRFRDITSSSGVAYTGRSWGMAWGDANGDALPDLYIGNHGAPRNLYFGEGTGHFREAARDVFDRPLGADAHGVAWADFDNDGDSDLIELIGAAKGTATKRNHLFVNQANVRFTEEALERGVADTLGRGRTPLWFDWDLDGFLDVLVLNGERVDAPSLLFRNAHGYFGKTRAIDGAINVPEFTHYAVFGSLEAGRRHLILSGDPFPQRVYDANQTSPLPMSNQRWALGIPTIPESVSDASLFDANGDGVDDVFVIKGVEASDALIDGDRLLSHIATPEAGGTRGFDFRASSPVTITVSPTWPGWWRPETIYVGKSGWHPTTIPFQLSKWMAGVDGLATSTAGGKGIYVGYDRAADRWKVRVVSPVFDEVNIVIRGGVLSGLRTVGFAPFVASLTPTFLLSDGGQYADATARYGLSAPAAVSNCFSATAGDFDNDADVDVFASCSGPLGTYGGLRNLLFRNNGAGWFSVVAGAAGVPRPATGVSDGVASADVDLDGFLDLALTNGNGFWPTSEGPTQVFHNTSWAIGNRNHWLQIDLRGVESNRDGVGARVRLVAGGKAQTRIQRNGTHNAGQDFARLHFGLGPRTLVDSLTVEWPSGARQTLRNVAADQVLRIVEARSGAKPYTVSPMEQLFGARTIDSGTSRTFTMKNTAPTRIPIVKIRAIGVDAPHFAVTSDCVAFLAAGASCRVTATFRPRSAGSKSARLFVVAGDKYVTLARLMGTGV